MGLTSMTPGEARAAGTVVALVLSVAVAGGTYLTMREHRGDGPRMRRERAAGALVEDEARGSALREGPFDVFETPRRVEPLPGARSLARCRGISREIAMDADTVYFADCGLSSRDCSRFDLYAVPRAGGDPRLLAAGQPSPRSLSVGRDAVYYLTSRDDRAPGPYGVMKVSKSGGPPTKVADAGLAKSLTVAGETLTWLDDHDKVFALDLASDPRPIVMASVDGEAIALAVAPNSYLIAVKNPSGQKAPDGLESRAFSLVRVPREAGATPRTLAQLDRIGDLAVDAEHVYWTAPSRDANASPECLFRMSQTGGAPTELYCAPAAHLSSLRIQDNRIYLLEAARAEDEVRIIALTAGVTSAAFQWKGSYPGASGYALEAGALSVKVKESVALVTSP